MDYRPDTKPDFPKNLLPFLKQLDIIQESSVSLELGKVKPTLLLNIKRWGNRYVESSGQIRKR